MGYYNIITVAVTNVLGCDGCEPSSTRYDPANARYDLVPQNVYPQNPKPMDPEGLHHEHDET